MKKPYFIILTTLMLSIPAFDCAHAEVPYQLAILYPVQVVSKSEDVKGIRCNLIYGVNNDVSGLDFGAINQVDGIQKGLQVGFFNNNFKTSGVQIGLVNKTEYLNGLQIGFFNIHVEGDRKFFPIVNFSF